MLRYGLILSLVLLSALCRGQTLEGRVTEDKSNIFLNGADVQNLRTKQHVPTDKNGNFSIEARVNDLVVFSLYNYTPDTLLVTDLKPKLISLQPQTHMLNEVQVNGRSEANKQATTMPKDWDYHNQTMNYQRNLDGPNPDGSMKGGVNMRIWSNKKEEHEAAKRALEAKNDKIATQIQKTFSEDNISKYVPLKNPELHSFIMRYSPDIKTYTAADFNLSAYLNKCYKEFIKLPPDERTKASIF